MAPLLLTNCQLYNTPKPVATDILIEDGQIKALGKLAIQHVYKVVPVEGQIVAPGFIDIHIQGAGGCDILDNTETALRTISTTLARYGVTGFLATTVIKPESDNAHLRLAADLVGKDLGGARLLGIHLEGPFINPQKRGGIAPSAVLPFSVKHLSEIMTITHGQLKMMTLAPEMPGGMELIKALLEQGVVPSLGHSIATYDETKLAIESGIKHVTHICNAMPPLHHREPGPVAAVCESPTVTAQIISDGVHVHPAMVRLLYNNLGAERCVCISDGIQAIGLPDGHYVYNGREYIAKQGIARYTDGTLIGTGLAVSQIAGRFQEFTHCALAEAVNTITINPVNVLGLGQLGKLAPGYTADLVVLDEDFQVKMTIINGRIAYSSSENNQ